MKSFGYTPLLNVNIDVEVCALRVFSMFIDKTKAFDSMGFFQMMDGRIAGQA